MIPLSTHQNPLPTVFCTLPLRSIEQGVQNSPGPALYGLDRFGQQLMQLLYRRRLTGPQVPAGSGFGDTSVVGRGFKRDVEVAV